MLAQQLSALTKFCPRKGEKIEKSLTCTYAQTMMINEFLPISIFICYLMAVVCLYSRYCLSIDVNTKAVHLGPGPADSFFQFSCLYNTQELLLFASAAPPSWCALLTSVQTQNIQSSKSEITSPLSSTFMIAHISEVMLLVFYDVLTM